MHSQSPNRAVAVAYCMTSPLGLNALPLFGLGGVLVCLGGLGDIVHHVAPSAQFLAPFVGADGVRGHILTLAGMLLALTGVIGRGIRR
jgi:hypothetical protein